METLLRDWSVGARWKLAGLIAFVVFGIPSIIGVWQAVTEDDQPRYLVTDSTPGYALGTELLRDCQSPANRTADTPLQMSFFNRYEVSATTDPQNGYAWLDYDASGGDHSLIVRYFAGTSDKPRCTFTLLKTANHPERDAVFQYFTRAGKPFKPAPNEYCYSSAPPLIAPVGPRGQNVATLRCDILEKEE